MHASRDAGMLRLILLLGVAVSLVSPLDVSRRGWTEYQETLQRFVEDPMYRDAWRQHMEQYSLLMKQSPPVNNEEFPCTVPTPGPKPTSVHQLTPSDIGVIGAMGDSITAGNGVDAQTVIGVLRQYRGLSWTVGGEESFSAGSTTVPNILKHYNPALTGYATATGRQSSEDAHLDVAIPGSVASGIPEQAEVLVERIRSMAEDGQIDLSQDWKVISLFIGGNDLCNICKSGDHTAHSYMRHIETALDTLKEKIPRVLVNVIPVFDITPVANMSSGIVPSILHWALCPCALLRTTRHLVPQATKEYSENLERLTSLQKYKERDDFAVVYQPFMLDMGLPTKPDGSPDFSYFAPDCFHFSRKGHNTAAVWLWNGMFAPVGRKPTKSDYNPQVYCPNQGEYIATWKNSGYNISRNGPLDGLLEEEQSSTSHGVMLGATLIVLLAVCLGTLLALGLALLRRRRSTSEERALLLMAA